MIKYINVTNDSIINIQSQGQVCYASWSIRDIESQKHDVLKIMLCLLHLILIKTFCLQFRILNKNIDLFFSGTPFDPRLLSFVRLV